MNGARFIPRAASLHGELRVPGDKSASHRALMLGALASGESTITGLSRGHDVASTATIMAQLGATLTTDGTTVVVAGPAGGLRASTSPLDCGNSGTTMRLLAGIVSGIQGRHRLTGDSSLEQRPMDRVATPLSMMGATVHGRGERVLAPLDIVGTTSLRAIEYHVPIPSAQVKSAILLAGLAASGHTVIVEDVRTRSTTEDMLGRAGVTVHSLDHGDGRIVTLTPGRPEPVAWVVPGDPSQAAFFAVLGAVHDDASITVLDVDQAPERIGYVGVLQRMGARLTIEYHDRSARMRSVSSDLVATQILSREIPSVDEVPALTVAAAAAHGVSVFRDMGELRVKESDRFAGALALAQLLGCRAWSEGDDIFVEGLGSARAFQPFVLDAGLDHRMVMAGAVAAAAGAGGEINGAQTVTSSYPEFFEDLASLQ
jgi:3-phosphoshikimate 1-carboxyvinyltransferase